MHVAMVTKAVWMFHTQKDIDRYMVLAYRFPCSFTIFIDLKIWTQTPITGQVMSSRSQTNRHLHDFSALLLI